VSEVDEIGPPNPDLLVFADDWGRHQSSCQHLVRKLRDDHRILWVNSIGTRRIRADALTLRRGLEKLRGWRKGVEQADDRMWVIDLPMLPGMGHPLLREANQRLVTWQLRTTLEKLGMADPVILSTLPYVGWLVRDLPRRATVYYCTDDYSHWPSADGETLRRADQEFSREADVILAVSRALLEQHGGEGRCRYFPHGVDFDHFASVQGREDVPEDLARLKAPRIGYFGLIYEKLDFELLADVARRFSDASLVLIGTVAQCPAEFASMPNVHLLGHRPYEELPRYLAGLEVLLLPYLAKDPMIRRSGPLKLRECLAAGKPTVSVDVPEVRLLAPHVRLAADRAAFLEHVGEALAETGNPARVASRQRAVEPDGWEHRAGLLRSYINEVAAAGTVATP
jgi:glycosyltransferase involved in cell wall biosynthesis